MWCDPCSKRARRKNWRSSWICWKPKSWSAQRWHALFCAHQPQLLATPTDAEAVHKAYGDIIRMTPPPPSTYSLEFLSGGATLTPQSQSELDDILTAATSRPGGEIIITGHTDTTGTPEANDRISQERANALRDFLTGRGFPAERVQAIGRGQRELLVPTGPGVDEAKNRRVVIVVR